MGYSTSVWETWGPCFYNISQQGSLIPFLKIYGLCVQERETGNHCSLNASPTLTSSQRPQEEAGAPALTATGTLRGGRRLVAVLSWIESACPWEDEPFDSLLFWLYLIAYKSFLHPTNSHQSQQLSEHRAAQTKAVNREEWCSQDGSSSITKTLPATLNHVAHILRVWRLSG